jgi:hypothetical protein
MTAASPRRIDDHARADLRFVREAMARSAQFSAVPGWGGAAMGVVAVAAAWIAHRQATPQAWLAVWLATAVVGFAVGVATLVHKASRHGVDLTRQPARGFALSLLPPLVAGALLTPALVLAGVYDLLPGLWLLLYGTAVVTGGAYSVRAIPLMGVAIAGIGAAALAQPRFGDLAMAAGFGGLQIGFGIFVARRYGG